MVLIPASLQVLTASITSVLGGSIIPTIPINVKSYSIFSLSSFGIDEISRLAKPSTRNAFLDMLRHNSCIFFLSTSVMFLSPFEVNILVHRSRISSTAPLV